MRSGEGPAGDPLRRLRSLLEFAMGRAASVGKAEAEAAYEHVFECKEDPMAIAKWLERPGKKPELPLHLDPRRHRFYYASGRRQKEEQFPEPCDRCASCDNRRDAHPKIFGGDGDPTMDWLANYLKTLGLYEARKEDR